ncbi:MAG: hypothetical protein JXQ90_17690 [Cyclobacteriaceae bacterium]
MFKSPYFFWSLAIVFFGLFLATIYYHLGGFEKVEVFQLQGTERLVAGKHYAGRQTAYELEKIYEDARMLILEEKINGTLTVVNYKNDSLASNELSQFIGVILEGEMAEIPPQFEVREFSSSTRLAVFYTMHPLVFPSPSSTEEKFQNFADSAQLSLAPYTFELHYQDNSMSVEAWVEGPAPPKDED